jgi:hypothetical protein
MRSGMSALKSPEYWHSCAARMRSMAEHMIDLESKAKMLRIADNYEFLARRAEARLKGAAGWP